MSYTPFKQMVGKLAKEPGVYDPKGLAAYVARKKYGGKAVQNAAAQGHSSLKHAKPVKVRRKKGGRRG